MAQVASQRDAGLGEGWMGERSVYQDSTDSLLEIKAKNDYLFFSFIFFWPRCAACGILVP